MDDGEETRAHQGTGVVQESTEEVLAFWLPLAENMVKAKFYCILQRDKNIITTIRRLEQYSAAAQLNEKRIAQGAPKVMSSR